MTDINQEMDNVIATPRASSSGSIFWVTPTQYNPQTGTYQTHYYSDDLVKSGTVTVGTPTWKNNSRVPQIFSSSNINKSVAAPVLIPPPQNRNLTNFEDPVVKIPDGIKELEYEEDDDDQSVVDIKQLNQNYDHELENGDHSNRAKNVVDAVVALGHVLVKDLQKAVPNLTQSGNSIFESCLAGSDTNELVFSPKNILRDNLKNNTQIKPHLLPIGVTLQELISSNQNVYLPEKKTKNNLSSAMISELFYDQTKFPVMSLISYDPSNISTNGLVFEKETMKRLNSDFGDSPLCFISLIDCNNELFSKLLLIPDLESSAINHHIKRMNDQKIGNSLVNLYYWYKDEEFIYILLDFKLSIIPKLHDLLLLLANSISSCVVMNNNGIINQDSLIKLSPIIDLQKEFENRQENKIDKLLKSDMYNLVNSSKNDIDMNETYNTPKKVANINNNSKSIQDNPLLLLTPRYKPNLRSESNNDLKLTDNELNTNVNSNTPRTLLCTLKTTPRPCLVWLLHDFNYLLYDNTNNMIWNSIDYFETLLNELGCGYECDESKIDYFENLKLYLKSYYKMKECHTLVSPYNSENDKIRVDHLKQVSCFRQRLLGISKIHALNHKIGQYNSSLTIKRFLTIYFQVLNNKNITNLSELNELIQRKFCDKILSDISDYYLNEHKELLNSLPKNDIILKENIKEIKTKCFHLYNEYTSTLIDTDIYFDYKIQLKSNLKIQEDETIKENFEASMKYCTAYLKEISDKIIINKLYENNGKYDNNIRSNQFSIDSNINKQYSILDLEKDLEELYETMINNLNDKIPKEVCLNCFLKLANDFRHEWYELNGDNNALKIDNSTDRIGIENCFGTSFDKNNRNSKFSQKFNSDLLKRIETPEMIVNRLNASLEEINSEYNTYTLMQKKELLEDILLEATKKKDRLSDFYTKSELYNLDCIIDLVQDKLDIVNTERKSIMDNNELQRQLLLKKKQNRWRKIFPCLNRDIRYNSGGNIVNDPAAASHSLNQNETY